MAARRSPNGSLVPLGFWPMAKMPASVSSLSASATAVPAPVRRQRAAGATRHVVLVDGGRDFRGLAIGGGVVAAHDALQFGKFAHHRGQQVALGELRGARACRASVSISRAISPASVATRRTLSPMEPSFAWNVTASSAASRAASGCLRSWLQKNAASDRRGRTTRSLPARTFAGSRLSMLLTVMKCAQQLSARAFHREIPLVMLQRGDQHLARQFEETRLETAGERTGPFDQRGDFVEQRLVDQRRAAQRLAYRDHLFADQFTARREIRDHLARARAAWLRTPPVAPAASSRGAMNRWPRVALRGIGVEQCAPE